MAAHIVTALREIANSERTDSVFFENVVAALDYAPWGSQVKLEHYGDLRWFAQVEDDGLKATAQNILPVYEAEWTELGEPASYEDWNRALEARDAN